MIYTTCVMYPEFLDIIQYRFCCPKQAGILANVYDGSAYTKYSEVFEKRYNLSFALNFRWCPNIQILHSNLASEAAHK